MQSRAHSARGESTRHRVLDAAVVCIADAGFQSSNLTLIARQAGVTTGAIQHQFGDKATLLAEVVERGFGRLVERLLGLPGSGQAIEARVGALVDTLWVGYDAASTRASLDILLAMRGDEAFRARSADFVAGMSERIDKLWMGTFWDVDCPRSSHVEAQRLVFSTLNGLALERILVPGMPDPRMDLARLARGILAIFKENSA